MDRPPATNNYVTLLERGPSQMPGPNHNRCKQPLPLHCGACLCGSGRSDIFIVDPIGGACHGRVDARVHDQLPGLTGRTLHWPSCALRGGFFTMASMRLTYRLPPSACLQATTRIQAARPRPLFDRCRRASTVIALLLLWVVSDSMSLHAGVGACTVPSTQAILQE